MDFYIRYGEYSKKISSLANGVNVLHLKPESMMSMTMLVPSDAIINCYEKLFEKMQSKIELLNKQITLATEGRERILPKLMTGEIEM